MALTLKQSLFPSLYIENGFNGTAAAIAAGYSKKGAHVTASQLLRNPKIQEIIERLYKRTERKIEAKIDRVVGELAAIALSDVTEIVQDGAVGGSITLKRLDDLPDHVRAAIAEVTETAGGLKVKLHNKTQAIELLGRYLGMWREQQRDLTPTPSDVAGRLRQALQLAEASGSR